MALSQSMKRSHHKSAGSLYLDEYDEEWGWVHPTDFVTGLALLRRYGPDPEDCKYELRVAESREYGSSGLVAEHIENGSVDLDCRRIASVVIGNCSNVVEYAERLLRAIAISRHGVLYRVAGHRAGHMRMDRIISQVQQRYIKLKPGGFAWSRELQIISGVPVLTPIISLNKISPWRQLTCISQCEDGSSGFQTYVLFLLLLHKVSPGAVQFSPTSISCAWPSLDKSLADDNRNVIVADATITFRTSTVLNCHKDHEKVGENKFHVAFAGLWQGQEFNFESSNGRIGFRRVAGIDDLNYKIQDDQSRIPIMDVFHSWRHVAVVERLQTVQQVYNELSEFPEEKLRSVRNFYSSLWEPLAGIRLELSDEEVFVDLSISLAAVMHNCGLKDLYKLMDIFLDLIGQEWVRATKESRVFPCRMGAPYTPAVLLNKERQTYYTFGSSFSWSEKSQVERNRSNESQIKIPGSLSRVYKDGLVIGDLDGTVWDLNSAELSLVKNGLIGWITEFNFGNDDHYSVVEVDVICSRQYEPSLDLRKMVAESTRSSEPRISSVRADDTDWVRKCLPIAVILLAAQIRVSQMPVGESLRPYDEMVAAIRLEMYEESDKLWSFDLAYLHRAMGSYGSRNKIWPAKALAEHKRIWSLLRNSTAPEPVAWTESSIRSRLLYSDREGVFVRARPPWDSLTVLAITSMVGIVVLIDATKKRDIYDLGTLITAILASVTGLTGLYHTVRYRGWALGDAVRAYRNCHTVEEMRTVMSLAEVHKTLLDAGEKGTFTDGVRTCAYSDHDDGNFALAKGLTAQMFEKCGGRLGIDSEGDDVIIYGSRIRKVELVGDGHAYVKSGVEGVFPVVKATRLKGAIME